MNITIDEAKKLALAITASARKGKSHSSSLILEEIAKFSGARSWAAFQADTSNQSDPSSVKNDANDAAEAVLYESAFRNWDDGEEGAEVGPVYHAKLERLGNQFSFTAALPHKHPDEIAGTPQLSILIEMNEGRLSAYLSNSIYGDNVLNVIATEGGLFLDPAATDIHISTRYPDDPSLAALRERLYPSEKPYVPNCGFIACSND